MSPVDRVAQAKPVAHRRPLPPDVGWPLVLSILLAGCVKSPPEESHDLPRPPLAGVRLTLAVVDDPPLAAAIQRLQGEWNLQTGADFRLRQLSQSQLFAPQPWQADALIGATHLLGPLVEQGTIAPLAISDLDARDARRPGPEWPLDANHLPAASHEPLYSGSVNWPDIFDLLRLHEVTWAAGTWAIPFGSPVLVCYCRADLLEKLGRQPPQTWDEYFDLARLLSDRKHLGPAAPSQNAPWYGAIEPLGQGWAGLVLLARAAAYAKHRDNYSTLFQIDTMEPLVAGPPFVRALEELTAAAKFGPSDALGYGPAEARRAFWQGHCGMALSWPTAAGEPPGPKDKRVRVVFSELPGSAQMFNVGNHTWEPRAEDEERHVPLLGIAGRIGIVARASSQPGAALELLSWLSSGRGGDSVAAASLATTLYRRTQLKSPKAWVEPPITPSAASQYAVLTEQTFRRRQWLVALRIPGREGYLSALDEAVRQAVQSQRSPRESLRQAAQQWSAITDRLGRQRQRLAYLQSLGIPP